MNKHQRTADERQSQAITASSRGSDGLKGGNGDDPTCEAIRNFETGKSPHQVLLDRVLGDESASDHSVPEGFAAQVIKTVRERGNAYGTPAENHQTTADMLSSWLSRRFQMQITLSAEDVIAINVIQKISRLANVSKDDSWLDIAGYTENVAMIRPDQRNIKSDAKRLDRVGL